MAGIVRSGDHGAKTTWGRSAGAWLRGESEVEKWSLYLNDATSEPNSETGTLIKKASSGLLPCLLDQV